MLCFPLDNVEYDAKYLGAWLATRTRGVFAADGNLSVVPNGGMKVKINPGLAWLRMNDFWGTVCFQNEALSLTVITAESALPRIDAVCARLNKSMNKAEIVIKKGTPQASPQIPAPVRNDDYDEIYLATVRVPAGSISVDSGNITDQRLNDTYCGIMRDGVTGIPTQDLYNAWYSWFAAEKASATEQQQSYAAELQEWLTGFKATNAESFNAWFDGLKDVLDDNQATNLYNMIEQHIQAQINSDDGVHGLRVKNSVLQSDSGGVWSPVITGVQGIKCNGVAAPADANGVVNITLPKITIGTVPPSGGSNGDIYIQI